MRKLMALAFVIAACGGTKPKGQSALVPEGSATPETCCCKHTPLASETGLPQYEVFGRMECSSKQGSCVDEVQCNQADDSAPAEPDPEPQDTGVPPPPDM